MSVGYTLLGFGAFPKGGYELAIPAGSEGIIQSPTDHHHIAWDSQTPNKGIYVYSIATGSLLGWAAVFTISGTTISFGTPTTIETPNQFRQPMVHASPHEADKYILGYSRYSPDAGAKVLTVSGTSITVGTYQEAMGTYFGDETMMKLDPHNNGKFFFSWRNHASGTNTATLAVGSWDGTTVSFGSLNQFGVGLSGGHSAVNPSVFLGVDPVNENKVVVGYSSYGNATYDLYMHVCTISGTQLNGHTYGDLGGTTISAGSYNDLNNENPSSINCEFHGTESGRFYVVYNGDSGNTRWQACDYSGTTITAQAEQNVHAGDRHNGQMVKNPNKADEFLFHYQSVESGESNYPKLTVLTGHATGAGVTKESTHVIQSDTCTSTKIAMDPHQEGRFMMAYKDSANSNYATLVLGQLLVE